MVEIIENKFFPELNELEYKGPANKYGILNVGLVRNKKVVTGYQWSYSYFDGEKVKVYHSYDLRILRKKVLDNGYEWVITDNALAIDSYKFNNELVKFHDEYFKKQKGKKYTGSSGVQYVSKQIDKRGKGYEYWRYSHEGVVFSGKSLESLKEKVEGAGYEWIIRDDELYSKNLFSD